MQDITIIIPIYKAEATLARCLDSLLAQTYPHWRAIMIDDASPDNSREIGRRYAAQDSRFIYMINERNMGVAATRNRGLGMLGEGYAAFLDSDDWWEPDALERLHSAAEKYNADIVQCTWFIDYPDGSSTPKSNTFRDLKVFDRKEFHIPLRKMLTSISMNHVYRKLTRCELFRDLQFNAGLRTAEDLELCFRLFMRAKNMVFIPDPLYHYFRAGTGLTGSGLPFRRKWKDNRAVSTTIIRELKGSDLDSRFHRILAWLRPYTITADKAMRILQDKRALRRKSV